MLTLCLVAMLALLPQWGLAAENQAEDISSETLVTDSVGFANRWYLFDGNRRTGYLTGATASITLSHKQGIGSLYLTFDQSYPTYSVVNMETGEEKTVTNGYLHDFVDLVGMFGAAPKSVKLCFENGQATLYEMKVFTPGQVPEDIQKWSEPVVGKTDLVLFAAHSDDDQIFFAGLLPYYAVERGYQVQVVYLTDHSNTYRLRAHEMLDGLWAVGVRTYPVMPEYPDFYNANNFEGAFSIYRRYGYDREDLTGYVVEQLRRFRPKVAVSHDFGGEYGHIQHELFAQLLADAVEVSADPNAYPESAATYGVWDVPKTYIHMYEENKIVLDLDQPMENFDGLTPYEVSRYRGFPCHGSQREAWQKYFSADKASELTWCSPCEYGLYRSTVGEDVAKNDMFENLISHAEQDRLDQEEAARLAEEQKRREEAEAEEQKKLEETKQRDKANRIMLADREKMEPVAKIAWIVGIAAVLVILIAVIVNRIRRRWEYDPGDF